MLVIATYRKGPRPANMACHRAKGHKHLWQESALKTRAGEDEEPKPTFLVRAISIASERCAPQVLHKSRMPIGVSWQDSSCGSHALVYHFRRVPGYSP